MRTTLHTLLAIVVRVAAFIAGTWAFTHAYEAIPSGSSGDVDLGEGLLAFMLMILVAMVWGAYDGYRRGFGPAAAIWITTGVLAGGLLAVGVGFGDQDSSLSLALADLKDSGPFLAGLILVPGVVAAALTAIVRGNATPSPTPR